MININRIDLDKGDATVSLNVDMYFKEMPELEKYRCKLKKDMVNFLGYEIKVHFAYKQM